MDFRRPFYSLQDFTVGLNRPRPTESETAQAADYLGLTLSATSLDGKIEEIKRELSQQNSFLSQHLSEDSVYSKLYQVSLSVREVVANNRSDRSARS